MALQFRRVPVPSDHKFLTTNSEFREITEIETLQALQERVVGLPLSDQGSALSLTGILYK
jgi:hypothetical protein